MYAAPWIKASVVGRQHLVAGRRSVVARRRSPSVAIGRRWSVVGRWPGTAARAHGDGSEDPAQRRGRMRLRASVSRGHDVQAGGVGALLELPHGGPPRRRRFQRRRPPPRTDPLPGAPTPVIAPAIKQRAGDRARLRAGQRSLARLRRRSESFARTFAEQRSLGVSAGMVGSSEHGTF